MVLCKHFSEGTEEKHENPQDDQSLSQDLNLGPPEYN